MKFPHWKGVYIYSIVYSSVLQWLINFQATILTYSPSAQNLMPTVLNNVALGGLYGTCVCLLFFADVCLLFIETWGMHLSALEFVTHFLQHVSATLAI